MTILDAAASIGKQLWSAIPIRPPNGGNMPRGTKFRLEEFDEGPPLKFKVSHASKEFGIVELPCASEEMYWFITEADWNAGANLLAL